MKCLLCYEWVTPRNNLPAGKGVMGAWAKLARRNLNGYAIERLAASLGERCVNDRRIARCGIGRASCSSAS